MVTLQKGYRRMSFNPRHRLSSRTLWHLSHIRKYLCLQSQGQRFPGDIFNKNSKDVSTMEGASEDILGYSQDTSEIEGQILQCPAGHWKMCCRTLAGHPSNILGYPSVPGRISLKSRICMSISHSNTWQMFERSLKYMSQTQRCHRIPFNFKCILQTHRHLGLGDFVKDILAASWDTVPYDTSTIVWKIPP